ncbi:MAG: DNA translocase FtsK 4TM domain-containing protein [Bacillota bacterium]|nr:DNA translocase FtsK 4TM domain-containing protein [Bacillota bacterium]
MPKASQGRKKLSSLTHSNKKSRSKEIAGVILAAIGVFLILSIYTSSTGDVGNLIKGFLSGVFGYAVYALPAIFIVIGILIFAARHRKLHGGKVALVLIFILALFPFLHIFESDKMNQTDFWKFLESSYQLGSDSLTGTGLWSAILAFPALKYIGNVGAYILFAVIMLISVIVLTNLSIRKMGAKISQSIRNGREEKEEARKGELYVGTVGEPYDRRFVKKDDEIVYSGLEERESPQGRARADLQRRNEVSAGDAWKALNTRYHGQTDAQYTKPPLSLLGQAPEHRLSRSKDDLRRNAHILEETLANFGISAKVVQISSGPTVTQYELQPAPGVKVSRITSLADDIAMNLATPGVRIEAPIPGKAAVGIEVPNREIALVHLSEVIGTDEYARHPSPIAFPLGKDIAGNNIIADLSNMPHLLVAGATGSGKSVCINSFIIGLLYKSTPQEVRMLMIDPKVVELSVYNGIPHLLNPVVTDPKKAASALAWVISEMTSRYQLFGDKGAKDIKRFNELAPAMDIAKVPHIVVIIDELSDLMFISPHEVEDSICRIAQLGRAAGIHLVVATQRPSVDVITGLIKANITSRIAFAVSSQIDSRTILDMGGAEKLLGRGDMLYTTSSLPKPIRIQGAFISDKEVESVVQFIKSRAAPNYKADIMTHINRYGEEESGGEKCDDLLPRAAMVALEHGQASTSLLQRKLRVGYARAARLLDEMEEMGLVSGFDGSKPRNVLMNRSDYERIFGREGS